MTTCETLYGLKELGIVAVIKLSYTEHALILVDYKVSENSIAINI